MFGRRKTGQLGLAPIPLPFSPPTPGHGGWRQLPVTPPWQQVGMYETPPPTMLFGGGWPDVQLKCGVEGINRNWVVLSPTGADKPWFQVQPYPQNPRHLLLSGNRTGGIYSLTSIATLYAPKAYSQAEQAAATAAGVLGF